MNRDPRQRVRAPRHDPLWPASRRDVPCPALASPGGPAAAPTYVARVLRIGAPPRRPWLAVSDRSGSARDIDIDIDES